MKETSPFLLDKLPEEDQSNIIPFQMKIKGPEGEDWLSPLPEGTTFLTRTKGKHLTEVNLVQHTVINSKPNKARWLRTVWANGQYADEWVVPVLFCAFRELVEIVFKPE